MLFFLLRRDYRAAATAALSFAVSTGAGFLLAPRDSVRYWTSVIIADRPAWQPGVRGQPVHPGRPRARRARPAHARPGRPPGWRCRPSVLALACRGMRRALAGSADAWALSLNAFAALLVSPISWSHHWVWGETAMLTLALLSRAAPPPRPGWPPPRRACRLRRRAAVVVPVRREPGTALGGLAAGPRQLVRDPRGRRPAAVGPLLAACRCKLLSGDTRYIVDASLVPTRRHWVSEGTVAAGYEMRVSDAEREAAAAELREHFASGRLNQDELDERLTAVFAAKTRGDLNALFTDLPSSGHGWASASASGERPGVRALRARGLRAGARGRSRAHRSDWQARGNAWRASAATRHRPDSCSPASWSGCCSSSGSSGCSASGPGGRSASC